MFACGFINSAAVNSTGFAEAQLALRDITSLTLLNVLTQSALNPMNSK
jgi:hypothetical protein